VKPIEGVVQDDDDLALGALRELWPALEAFVKHTKGTDKDAADFMECTIDDTPYKVCHYCHMIDVDHSGQGYSDCPIEYCCRYCVRDVNDQAIGEANTRKYLNRWLEKA